MLFYTLEVAAVQRQIPLLAIEALCGSTGIQIFRTNDTVEVLEVDLQSEK